MKAIVYNGKKNVDVENVEDPKIEKSDDIIIKVTSTAICGSDLHLIHGMIPNMPKGFRLGHETMGIVEEVGKDVVKVKKNDRVIIPFPVACGHCCFKRTLKRTRRFIACDLAVGAGYVSRIRFSVLKSYAFCNAVCRGRYA